eukprot:TRINITY_DN28162_c0_g1_i1.p1 TRINITY_DN28162_c0_g1~~TRINITY_DN28162_c0_g1_i1.p1  ORF type:complete len:131 (+),score=0.69 TRINITY_DN28162_c0_g1_i1:94-486(+)
MLRFSIRVCQPMIRIQPRCTFVVEKQGPTLTGKAAFAERLKAGERVTFRLGGNSMTPRIKRGQRCAYEPVRSTSDIKVGDAVFCRVGHMTVTHLVTAIQGDRVQISNNHGYVNGWTSIDQIFGKVIEVGV